jgi:magnesium-transporting ATPase (P-type)
MSQKGHNDQADGRRKRILSRPTHAMSVSTVLDELGADALRGLSTIEATARLNDYGLNELQNIGGVHPVKILLRQIVNVMTLVMCIPISQVK